ncbi:MAG: restriction endonuclease subunit S [Planctomycetes bacterium]|nr:restriction endonuclease subunit S [Planctomycetota bacterium]
MAESGDHDFRPYPEYRDSGLPWLGAIPAHWDVRRVRHCGRIIGGGTPSMKRLDFWGGQIPWVSPKDMKSSDIENSRDHLTEAALHESNIALLQSGAVLLVVRGMILARRIPIAVTRVPVTINQDMKALLPHEDVHPRYLMYALEASKDALSEMIDEAGHGTKRLPTSRWRQLEVWMPPVEEQKAIGDFLDVNGAMVRRLIRNRRRLVEVLNEQKQAIINRAITRGLDSSVRLEPSGIDWLGDVPAHWKQRRLKFLVRNVNEQTGSSLPDEIYVALEHVESWTGRITLPKGEVAFESQVKRFRPNDVLFGKLRPYLAKVARPQVPGVCVGEFLVLRVIESGVLPEFLEQKLRSKQLIDLINSSTFGAKMPRADWTFIGNIAVVYPRTHDEQRTLLDRIGEQTATLQSAIDKAKREIELIHEYRTRLIADVVTGKVDVRHLASTIEGVETEPEDRESIEADEGIDDETLGDEEAALVEETADADD